MGEIKEALQNCANWILLMFVRMLNGVTSLIYVLPLIATWGIVIAIIYLALCFWNKLNVIWNRFYAFAIYPFLHLHYKIQETMGTADVFGASERVESQQNGFGE